MKIAVTGIGLLAANGVGQMQHLTSRYRMLPIGEVDMPSSPNVPRSTSLGIIAAREALQDAHLVPTIDMAFINGTTVGGMDLTEHIFASLQQGIHNLSIVKHDTGSCTQDIADALGRFGYLITPSTACSSSLNSIITGCQLLRTHRCKQVLAGGTEALTLFHLNGFHALHILDEQVCRPFADNRAGLNLGEGAAYLLLETEEDALLRHAHIYGYINGYANTCDAFHQTASSDNGEGAYLAMKQAMANASLMPSDVDFIKAHGTGTPNNDASELAAMHRLFGEHLPAYASLKPLFGHTTSASGSIEAAHCLRHMQGRNVLCNAFGFGGNDSSVVLSLCGHDYSAVTPYALRQPIVSVSAPTDEEVRAGLSPLEARRMTPQMRRIVVAAMKALQEAHIAIPDAIITATKWGCISNSVKFLLQMLEQQEQSLSPTAFIQSTHNTISSIMGIRLHAHGYNATYAQENALEMSFLDASMQIELGQIHNALILHFDEEESLWQTPITPHAEAYILTA